MRRLIAKIVFSGLVIACRRAIWPTSRSPLSVKATTDGVIRLPSALVMTTGSPPSMTETHELVVPRSIPITFAISRFLPSGALITALVLGQVASAARWPLRGLGDAHERRPKQPIVEAIARLMLVHHRVRWVLGALDVGHRLVMGRVEGRALRLDALHPVALEDVEQALQHEL